MANVDVTRAIELLSGDEIVALPTETVYGLAGRIDSEAVLKKIFAAKQRPLFDPLIVHVTDQNQARALTSGWPEIYEFLCDRFWPGPLTVVAPKLPSVSKLITSGLETVALRCPNHKVFLEVIRGVGVPLAAPSANRFGRTSPTAAAHVDQEFSGRIPVVDGGPCTVGVESTVIQIDSRFTPSDPWPLKILRPGGISRRHLRESLDDAGFVYRLTRDTKSVATPGHLKNHYQPLSPVILLEDLDWSQSVQSEVERRLGRRLHGASQLELCDTPQEMARLLYEKFRGLSVDEGHAIWICRRRHSLGEDWEAVWDRIERASSLIVSSS